MKKTLVILAATALSACGGAQVTPIQGPSGNTEYLVDCGHHGLNGGDWAQCYAEASKACPSGYAIRDKNYEAGPVFANSGTKRTILVACKSKGAQ